MLLALILHRSSNGSYAMVVHSANKREWVLCKSHHIMQRSCWKLYTVMCVDLCNQRLLAASGTLHFTDKYSHLLWYFCSEISLKFLTNLLLLLRLMKRRLVKMSKLFVAIIMASIRQTKWPSFVSGVVSSKSSHHLLLRSFTAWLNAWTER